MAQMQGLHGVERARGRGLALVQRALARLDGQLAIGSREGRGRP